MKEDILEQIVEDYLQSQGYFTRHNVKYKPRPTDPGFITNKDAVHSDVDVIAVHPLREGPRRVLVVSCKSWQNGFNPYHYWREVEKPSNTGKYAGKEAWMSFRELTTERWSLALRREVERLTGQADFVYLTAVTRLKVGKNVTLAQAVNYWVSHPIAQQNIGSNSIEIITVAEMVRAVLKDMTTTVEGSLLGRTLQVLKTADCLAPNLLA